MIKRLASRVCILLVIGMWWGVSSASIYTINRAVGGGTVAGTITTDGTMGVLSSINITAWDLDIELSSLSSTMTMANSAFHTFGAVTGITATVGELLFDARSSVDGGFMIGEGLAVFDTSWSLCSGGSTQCPFWPPDRAETVTVGGGAVSIRRPDAVFNIATASIVPIPAAVWLFGSGFIGLIGVARRKVRA